VILPSVDVRVIQQVQEVPQRETTFYPRSPYGGAKLSPIGSR
jgi:GDP-D-mannose dehydratase